MACDGSAKAIIHFSSPNTVADSFSTTFCPVTVAVEYIPGLIGGQCVAQYTVSLRLQGRQSIFFTPPCDPYFIDRTTDPIYGPIRSVTLFDAGISGQGCPGTAYKEVKIEASRVDGIDTDYFFYGSSDFIHYGIDNISFTRLGGLPDNCGNLPDKYRLKVTDTRGQVFVRDFTQPPTYSIQCAEDCPLGFLRCPHPSGIGFCCLDCDSLNSRIANLANRIQIR